MALKTINIGTRPNDGNGDTVRNAFIKTNDNFTELYDKYEELLDFNLPTFEEWQRPSDWLTLDIPSDDQQKFIALYAIRDNPYNYCAFTVQGNYTVDWGDGTVENYSSNTKAQHLYDFDDSNLVDTLTSDGYKQAIITVTPQSGNNLTSINLGVKHSFYDDKPSVIVVPGYLDFVLVGQYLTTFKVTQQADLTAQTFTATKTLFNDGGTLYSLPYESDSASSSVNTEVLFRNLHQFYIGKNALTTITENFQFCYNLRKIERLDLSNSSCFAIGAFEGCENLQVVKNFKMTGPSAYLMFNGCGSLKYINSEKISVRDCESMFSSCESLQYVKIDDFSNSVFCIAMFQYAYGLQRVCISNAIDVVTFESAFYECFGLLTSHITNIESLVDIDTMYSYCRSLVKAKFTDTPVLVTGNSAFNSCYCLKQVEGLNFKSLKEMVDMFYECYSLKSFSFNSENNTYPIYADGSFFSCLSLKTVSISSNTTFQTVIGIFQACPVLESVSNFKLSQSASGALSGYSDIYNIINVSDNSNVDTSEVVNGSSLFNRNIGLTKVSNLNFDSLQNATSMFLYCENLTEIGSINLTSVTTAADLFTYCYNLSRSRVYGITVSHSYQDCYNLSGTALNEIFTNLGTAAGGSQSLNLTNVLGTADPEFNSTIATAKGWTLVY